MANKNYQNCLKNDVFVYIYFVKQTLKYIYEKFYEEVKYAETKHSISLTLASALAVFSATYLTDKTPVIVILSASSIIFSLISVIYSFCALYVKEYKTTKDKKHSEIDLLSYRKNSFCLYPGT